MFRKLTYHLVITNNKFAIKTVLNVNMFAHNFPTHMFILM